MSGQKKKNVLISTHLVSANININMIYTKVGDDKQPTNKAQNALTLISCSLEINPRDQVRVRSHGLSCSRIVVALPLCRWVRPIGFSSVVVDHNHYRFMCVSRATSSLPQLPVQYSHCMRINKSMMKRRLLAACVYGSLTNNICQGDKTLLYLPYSLRRLQ